MEENNKIKISLGTAIFLFMLLLIMITVIFLLIINISTKNKQVEPNITLTQGNNSKVDDFSLEFLKLENNQKNITYSPLSIKYALNMLNDGANGKTKTQIQNVIGNTDISQYDNIDKILSLANGIYIRDTYEKYVKTDYKENLITKYNSEINYDSFNNANNINKWIENKTLGRIKNMIKDDLVQNPDTEMILINALAIDMEWEEAFDAENTRGMDFNLVDGSKMNAATMNKETESDNISYYKNNNIESVTMDLKQYGDTQLDFTAIMPNENLADYIKEMKTQDVEDIIKKSTKASNTKYGLNISIPKFSFDYDLKLKEDLMKLGMTDAFDIDSADFSNMTNNPIGLYVSDALHKANMDFSDKGVKAAAVTTILMTDKATMIADMNEPEEIKFDKPFLYVVRDKNTNEIWFIGTVYEPTSWEKDKENYEYR